MPDSGCTSQLWVLLSIPLWRWFCLMGLGPPQGHCAYGELRLLWQPWTGVTAAGRKLEHASFFASFLLQEDALQCSVREPAFQSLWVLVSSTALPLWRRGFGWDFCLSGSCRTVCAAPVLCCVIPPHSWAEIASTCSPLSPGKKAQRHLGEKDSNTVLLHEVLNIGHWVAIHKTHPYFTLVV